MAYENRFLKCPHEYTDKNGEKKTSWKEVGRVAIAPDGNIIVELNDRPNVKFIAFPPKQGGDSYQNQSVNTVDIPF